MITFRPLAALLLATTTLAALPALADETPARTGRPDRTARQHALFDRLDLNKDGFIDRDESKAARLAVFERLDANKDGKLTADELAQGRRSQGSRRAPGDVNSRREGTPPAAAGATSEERRRTRAERLVQRLDSDKDGAISRAEWLAVDEARFARRDADKDGRLAFEEWRFAQGPRRRPPTMTP
ncbi:MAG: EF-hand domain-containing protein [Alphaproteobacteria bacterium]|nr:EF-hand domain-containing protein [Alphaproteobacteria bacterium]